MRIIYLLFILMPYFLFAQAPAGTAEMKINEFLYRQVNSGTSNEEFIEFYVTQSGNIEGYIFTDQDSSSGHRYTFPSKQVNQGDYVILHVGSGTDNSLGNKHHFYMGLTPILNNAGGDDILLLRPDTTDSTNLGGTVFSVVPFDFVSYGTSGTALDTAPTSLNGVTVNWNNSENSRLLGAASGTSISLTPNAVDGDTSLCWEMTAITDISKKATNCTNYIATIDSNTDANMINSMGQTNVALPKITLAKSSCVLTDLINGTSTPKRIPGATIRYALEVKNEGDASADNIIVTDDLATEFDTSTIENLQVQEGACDCLGVASASNNGANGSANGVNPIKLDFGTIGAGSSTTPTYKCGYFEVKLK